MEQNNKRTHQSLSPSQATQFMQIDEDYFEKRARTEEPSTVEHLEAASTLVNFLSCGIGSLERSIKARIGYLDYSVYINYFISSPVHNDQVDSDGDVNMIESGSTDASRKGKKRGKYNLPSDEDIRRAILDKARGESISKAASSNNIKNSTLHGRIAKKAETGSFARRRPGPKKKII
ncbi:hypothetical protein INT45_002794 [Circinella minor]|uniref:Uncharacterized protein n=1 Tax=Circinella minor TaxID=1195481 RepID=A0A8H7RSM7_9FUNG|nr:hypothetical protein INT45_002794 [Circinella minor]